MVAQKKYPDVLRERAVKMVQEVRERDGKRHGEIARVARQVDVHPEGLWSGLQQAEIDGGKRPGTTTDDKQRIAEVGPLQADTVLSLINRPCLTESGPLLPRS
jgi:transposase